MVKRANIKERPEFQKVSMNFYFKDAAEDCPNKLIFAR